ncbi:MAG TPA: exosortase A [Candidatus Bathyarchaeia archaeon]|nr:exosortase A [Candidatus Bathyarchaeia archaeon]
MALAGTKPGTTLTPAADEVLPAAQPSSSRSSLWQTLKPFGWQGLLLVAVLTLLYAPVVKLLVWQWYNDPDYGHGFLVPLLSAYLIWARRDNLRQIVRRPSAWGMAVVLGSMGFLFLGSLGAENSLSRLSILGTICGLIVYFAGWAMLRALTFPLAFLLFAIPFPAVVYNEIVFPLQFLASKFATRVLEMLGLFPVMREGNVLVLPQMRLEVVEACSGIRSLMSLLALAAGYGYVVERSVAVRWLLVIAMVPLAIVSNGTRVMITAIMAHYIGPEAAQGFMHEFSGWVIFVVATILFLGLHSVITFVRKKLGWYEPGGGALTARVGQ